MEEEGLKIRKDKAKHMGGSFVLTMLTYLASGKLWFAVVVVFIIGLSKEIYDYFYGGVPSWQDMAANILGICFAIVVIFILKWRKKEESDGSCQ